MVRAEQIKKIQICLNFLNSHRLFNNLVVGFDNAKQYEDFLNCNKIYEILPKKYLQIMLNSKP